MVSFASKDQYIEQKRNGIIVAFFTNFFVMHHYYHTAPNTLQ